MSISNISRLTLGSLMLAFTSFSLACGGDPAVPMSFGCGSTPNANFPTSGTITLLKPAVCPFTLDSATNIPFAATATVSKNLVVNGHYDAWVDDRDSAVVSWSTTSTWSSNLYVYFVQITGTYLAGHGGYNTSNAGYDTWHHQFQHLTLGD